MSSLELLAGIWVRGYLQELEWLKAYPAWVRLHENCVPASVGTTCKQLVGGLSSGLYHEGSWPPLPSFSLRFYNLREGPCEACEFASAFSSLGGLSAFLNLGPPSSLQEGMFQLEEITTPWYPKVSG